MGESGSGKSTLLNILAMLDQPTEGRVYLNGTDTSTIKNKDASSFRREKLGFVFQDFNLLDTLSVKDNILLPLVLSRRPVKEMIAKVDSVSRGVGHPPALRKIPLRNLWWAKTTGSRSTGYHHLARNPPGR